eukprot:TRINITY_DN10610_c4_g1_i1.p1 TRINITY_DN10610_c4_g1~~TRINITY_DN10610_c4_g1_i1.p1  ORF type:complete len:377 (+),score=66.76 TRINITY_DN10610_c4_g1_i1:67-1197(+)
MKRLAPIARRWCTQSASMPFVGWTDKQCEQEVLSKKGSADEIHQRVARLKGGGGTVGAATYKTALKLLAAIRSQEVIEKYHEVFNMMHADGIVPGQDLRTDILRYWETMSARKPRETAFCVRQLLALTEESKSDITVEQYSIVLSIAAKTRDEGLCHHVYTRLPEDHQNQTSVADCLVASSCTLQGLERGLAILDKLGFEPTTRSTVRAIRIYSSHGLVEKLEDFMLSHPSRLANKYIVAEMMRAYSINDLNEQAVELFEASLPKALTVDSVTHCIKACGALHAKTSKYHYIKQAEDAHELLFKYKLHNNAGVAHVAISTLWKAVSEREKPALLSDRLSGHGVTTTNRVLNALNSAAGEHSGVLHRKNIQISNRYF